MNPLSASLMEQTNLFHSLLCNKPPPPPVGPLHIALQLLPHLEEERPVLRVLRLISLHSTHQQR